MLGLWVSLGFEVGAENFLGAVHRHLLVFGL